MTTEVDRILDNIDRADEVAFWTAERLSGLQTIKTFSSYWAEVSTKLDKIPVSLRITYNDIDGGFFVDIKSDDGTINVKGLRASSSADMLDGLVFSELGKLIAIDMEKGSIDPTYEGFGTRFALVYLPRAASV